MQPSIPKTASLSLWQIIPLYIGSVLGSGILLLPGLTADSAGPASILAWILLDREHSFNTNRGQYVWDFSRSGSPMPEGSHIL